jgi:ADP-ribose pyrophosphatase YjhB (NUDIX family)
MMNKTVTFDFDNTIAMSYMNTDSDEVQYVFQGYNDEIIDKMKTYIQSGYDVHIVTARYKSKEGMFPSDTIEKHLERLNLAGYFWPDKVHYTDDQPKLNILRQLGSILHYDDNIGEHIRNFGIIPMENPLESFKDSYIVTKVLIFDRNDNILLLKRSDGNKKWDIPGGHVKEIEAERGEEGLLDGLEREVGEETGLFIPFADKLGDKMFTFKKKKSHVYVYRTKIEELEPEVNLKMQDFMENEEYRWVPMAQMAHYVNHSTKVLEKAIEYVQNAGILTEKQAWYKRRRRKDVKNRKKLIGMGGNKSFGGGKGHSRPKMGSPKSAPPAVGVLEEENEEKTAKIRVNITPKQEKCSQISEKKRKKAPKKAKKGPKMGSKRGKKGQKYAYYGGDIGGDGGGE